MAWGIRGVIRNPDGTIAKDFGELTLRGEPYAYSTRVICAEAIGELERTILLDLSGMLEPCETGREISYSKKGATVGFPNRSNFAFKNGPDANG